MQGPYKVRVQVGASALVHEIDADSYLVTPWAVVFYKGKSIVNIVSMSNLIDMTGEPDPEREEASEEQPERDRDEERVDAVRDDVITERLWRGQYL